MWSSDRGVVQSTINPIAIKLCLQMPRLLRQGVISSHKADYICRCAVAVWHRTISSFSPTQRFLLVCGASICNIHGKTNNFERGRLILETETIVGRERPSISSRIFSYYEQFIRFLPTRELDIVPHKHIKVTLYIIIVCINVLMVALQSTITYLHRK